MLSFPAGFGDEALGVAALAAIPAINTSVKPARSERMRAAAYCIFIVKPPDSISI
jgi:hypothetical protein